MTKVFFTSDIHLGHKGVLDFDNRPWKTVEEMNAGLTKRWNDKVSKHDHVYILGDLCWLSGQKAVDLIKPLNGNLHLIRGNHDRTKNESYRQLFHSIKDYDAISVSLKDGTRKKLVLCHYPIPLYNGHHHGALHLYGHVHNTVEELQVRTMVDLLQKQGNQCEMHNVWCGFYDWAPATIDEIVERGNLS